MTTRDSKEIPVAGFLGTDCCGGWFFWLVYLIIGRARKDCSVNGTGGRGFSMSTSYITREGKDRFFAWDRAAGVYRLVETV